MLRYLILIVLPLAVVSQDKPGKCEQPLIAADKCFRKFLYIGDPDIKFIKSDADMKGHCEDYKASIKCYNTFVNCLGMPKALLFDYMMVGVKKIQQERCQNDAGKKEFMGAIKCLNKDNNMKVRFCLDKLAFLAGTIDKKNKDIMQPSGVPDIKGLCCYIAYTVDCVTTLAKSECKADGDKIAAYIKKIATTLLGTIGTSFCPDIANYDFCKSSKPNIVKSINTAVADKSKIKTGKTGALYALAKMLKRLFVKE